MDETHRQISSNPHKYGHKNHKNKSKTSYKLLFGDNVLYEVYGRFLELDEL
jgi:hypothetical protein